jgi:hypothetical protein
MAPEGSADAAPPAGRPAPLLWNHVRVHEIPAHPGEAAVPTRIDGLLGELDERDFDRVAAPAGLWEGIAAAIAADDAAPVGAGGVVEYAIDANDVVVSLGQGWAEFANANDAPELADGAKGRTLWDQIGDAALADLWRTTVALVRAQRAPLTVPFRCDGPSARRWFEMTLTPLTGGGVHFRSELTFEMARPDVPLLAVSTPRDTTRDVIAICSWCAEGDDGARWLAIEELLARRRLLEQVPAPGVSYGICPRCTDRHTPAARFSGPEATSQGS